MKPLKLEMEAFGSYLEKAVVDFTRLGSQGVFLICGDTAAGKTTIFDGICFALYGRTSGLKEGRTTSMMRSDYAAADVKTRVGLAFENGGKLYRIERVPTYLREGYKTPVKSEVALQLPDGRVITNITDADQMIREILGLEFSQFHQVSMLAQGEFRELLTLDTKSRTPVFRSIFQTGIFEAFQRELSRLASEAAAEEEKIRSLLREHIKTLELPDTAGESGTAAGDEGLMPHPGGAAAGESGTAATDEGLTPHPGGAAAGETEGLPLRPEREKTKGTDTAAQGDTASQDDSTVQGDTAVQGESIVQEGPTPGETTYLQELREAQQAAEREYSNKTGARYQITGPQLAKLLQNLQKLQQSDEELLAACIRREKEMQARREKLLQEIERANRQNEGVATYRNCIAAQRKLRQQSSEITKIKERLAKSGRAALVLAKEKEYVQAVGSLEKTESALSALRTRFAQVCAEEQESAEACQKANSVDTGALEQQLAARESDLSRARGFLEPAKQLDGRMRERAKKEEQFRQAKNSLILQQETLERLRLDCIHSLAYRLAKQLQDGSPCPICGSLTHPAPAKEPEEYVSEEQVEAQEKRVKKAQEREKECESAYHEVALYCSREAQNFSAAYPKLEFQGGYLQAVEAYEKECASRFLREKEKLKAVRKEARDTLTRWQQAVSKKDKLSGSIQTQTEALAQAKQLADRRRTGLEQEVKDQSFSSVEEAKMCALPKEQADTLADAVQKYGEDVIANETLLRSVAAYAGQEPANIDGLQGQVQELAQKQKLLQEEKRQPEGRISFNGKALQKLQVYAGQYRKAQETYRRYARLSEAADGKNYKFETYILEVYFDCILTQANRRLGILMKNQFELRRGEKSRGSRGLDINVYDYRTGRLRDVRTLSGGEAFVTSLALAFGLSDIVQGNNSGTRIETMFIDEGFGTLDSEVLEQSIRVLEQMASGNVLIGIISHKEELQSRIDNKIMVKKKDGKSRIYFCG